MPVLLNPYLNFPDGHWVREALEFYALRARRGARPS